MKKTFPSHTPVQRGYHTDFLMASGNSVPTANSLSSLSTGAARFASGDTGSNSIVSSTAVSPPPSSTTSNTMRQFSAMPASPSVEANASDDDDDPLRRVVAVSSLATQVHVTVRGSRGGKPNISVTLSPFLRGLSTAFVLPPGERGSAGSTPKEEATMEGQFVGVARKSRTSQTGRPLMVVLEVRDRQLVEGRER
mmetsp:Transcript_4094/g.8538  ORF Transcript_4094/g.8538 Transcript_4094/m.8538 type:complete len:195 (+) Transcript_4094:158-742(+)